ncbi:hypothetical protein ACPOLB_20095 [Rubrivivax sp. RP6-9]|uniref:hypothetical protein n=1 Tax=Rubrivivax sp. RP6-9 TaxID=3415750 RepID=UPI003CC614B9
MKDLQDATERICELKGSLVALDALVAALLQQLPADTRSALHKDFAVSTEVARTVLLHALVSDITVDAFERDVARMTALIGKAPPSA